MVKRRNESILKDFKRKYEGISIVDICGELAKHKHTRKLVHWFGDYAVWEPASWVSDLQIYSAYDKLIAG